MLVELQNAKPKFPRLGILHKGAPRAKNSNRPGKDLTYFRLDAAPEVVAIYHDLYGQQPTEIPIQFTTERAIESFDANFEEYDKTGIRLRCDGEYLLGCRVKNKKDPLKPAKWYNYTREMKRECRRDMENCACDCRKVGTLRFLIPGLLQAGHVGEILFSFTSEYDISEIYSNLIAVNMDARNGRFLLRRTEREVVCSFAGDAKKGDTEGRRMRQTKSLCQVVPEPEWLAAMLAQSRFDSVRTLETSQETLALQAPSDYEIDDYQALPSGEVPFADAEEYFGAAIAAEVLPPDPIDTLEVPSEPEDYSDIIAAIGVEMKRVGWTREMAQKHCKTQYGKGSSGELGPVELSQMRAYLQGLDTAEVGK